MIEGNEPASWKELQIGVARILSEAGLSTAIEKSITTARGVVSVDVWAHDSSATPARTYLIECKHWKRRVPKTVVHAFRSVLVDFGANWGAIVSSAGFQSGAYAAAQHANVQLLTWREFESVFEEQWFARYFVRALSDIADPLIDLTLPLNKRALDMTLAFISSARYFEVATKHRPLATFCLLLKGIRIGPFHIVPDEVLTRLDLPLRADFTELLNDSVLIPPAILDAQSYRALLEEIAAEVSNAVSEFDAILGEDSIAP